MTQLPKIEPFDAKFEDLNIRVDRLNVSIFNDDPELKHTALTDIRHIKQKHTYENGRDLVGDLVLIFRNQGKHFDSMMMVDGLLMIKSEIDNDGASVFCKMIQYMFDWINKYVSDNKIKDMNGDDFVMPGFHYSKADFPSFQG